VRPDPRVAASPGTRVKDRTELKDRRVLDLNQKEKKGRGGGGRKDSLNKAGNKALARAGEPPIRPPLVSTQGGP
jgi:hypothetical protein